MTNMTTVDSTHDLPLSLTDVQAQLENAFQGSLQQDDPEILLTVIRRLVEHYGMTEVVNASSLKSRSSAYKLLAEGARPGLGAIVSLCHGILHLAQQQTDLSSASTGETP